MMKRTDLEWIELCDKITAGYTPGGEKRSTFTSSGILLERLLRWYTMPIAGEGIKLLDLGCGNGRLPMGLVYNGYTEIDYTGIDVIKPCIDFCKMAFKPWPRFKFIHTDVENGRYWGKGKTQSKDAILPIPDNSIDVFWANSLFTHLGKPAITFHYLQETVRVMKRGAISITTWRLSEESDGKVSYEPKQSIFPRSDVEDFYAKAGLKITGSRHCLTTPQFEFAAVKI